RRGRRGGRDRGGEGASRRDPRLEAIVEQFRPLQGRPVLGVSITCDFAECAAPERNTVLRQITRLDRGTPLRPEDVADAWLRLVSTGLFRDLRVDAAPRGAQVEVRFTGVWAVVITDLRIEYDRLQSRLYPQQFRSEIRKRLSFRKGSSFPPLQADGRFSPADQAEIDDQRARIADLYERQGYEGTEVEFLPEYHGENRKFVELVVRVHEGRQPEIGQVLVQGNQAFSYSRILAALSTGERVDFWRDLFGAFGLGRYAQRQFREELKGVEALYRSQGYVAARVRLEGTVQRRDGKVFPLVRVREGPRVTASFEGNESLDDEELAAVLTFEGTGAYDETEIASSIEAIKDLYQEIARYYVEVEASAERTPTDGVHVRFQIDEGPRVYVRAIELVGSKAIPLEELLAAMETKGVAPDGVINTFVASSGVLQDARVINDLLALRNLYYDQGFLGVRFRCADPRLDVATWTARRLQEIRPSDDFGPAMDPSWFAGRFDVWSEDPIRNRCFLVESDADPRLVTLHMELSEGPRTTVDRVAIDALLAGMDAEMRDEAFALLQTLGLVDDVRRPIKGAGLNPKKIQAIRSFVLRYFHREGYLQAEITPLCFSESGSARSHADCTTGRLYGAHIDRLQFDITPGPRSEVDGVLLRGNLLTKPAIIEHELLLSDRGALGTDALFRSQANLRSLGVFDSVSVTPIGRTENSTRYAHANPTTVNVVVEEGRYQIIDTVLGLQIASTPLSADELPVLYTAGISARDRNLLGRAVEGGVGFTHANRIDTPQDVSGDDASWEVGLFFKDRRLFGTRLDLTVEIPFEQGQTAQRDAYQQVFSAKTVVGYDFYNLSYPAEWGRGMRTTWTLEFHRERRRPLTRASERPPYDDFDNFLSLAPALTWERRDNSLHPTRGWFASLATEAVSSDFGIDPDVSFKATLIGQTVHSFFERRLIIAPTLRVGGVITDRREADLPGDFLYKAGGDSVALPVRGYADASIEACRARDIDPFCVDVFDPEDEDRELPFTVGGRAMVSGSLELRWPTFLLDDFWFAAFVDVGAVAIQWDRITDDDIFPSVGGGLRWLVTGQIPLRLDVGVPLRATAFSPQEPRLHLNIFYTL
ncbi:MAG: BamA/TamA family outer membrane protein, partial [Myxococcales bacterium]|nr:BamA/TamA family outer membrane protein [Myxococcales bacterium]